MALDHAVFLQTFNRLAVATRESRADSAMQEVYFRALEEFDTSHVSKAALLLAKEPDRKFFPSTGEWVSAILAVRATADRELLARPPNREEPWHFECEHCDDTGWVPATCDGLKEFGETAVCGRRKPHYPHTYTIICPCRETNQTYLRNNVRERKRA